MVCMAFVVCPARAQMIDQNHNGMSDVWEWLYNSYGISPGADPDSDGFSNLQEAAAGTNPLDSNSYPRIVSATLSGTNLMVTFPCAPGKLYRLQSVTPPSTDWVNEASLEAETGTNLTLVSPGRTAAMKFYRIAISDVDSDGTGLMNDWEKYQLGLSPSNAWSNAQEDGNGNPMSDYAYALAMLSQQNVLTISATDYTAVQPDPGMAAPNSGVFTITRGGFPLGPITANVSNLRSGTAGYGTNGVDYSPLSATSVLAAGAGSQNITVTPLANTNLHTPVVVTLQLLPGAGYTVGNPSNATVIIYPSPTATGAGLLGQYFTNSSTNYSSALNFNPTNQFLTRTDAVVDFVWSTNTTPNLAGGKYTVRWTGQVEPQYSETYTFDTYTDDGVKLWVNDQLLIDKWVSQSVTDWTNPIALQAGVRYDIKMEYLQTGSSAQAHLSWYSSSQAKEVIPSNNLYSAGFGGNSNAPSVITSPLTAVGFVGQLFSFTVTGANTPLGFAATGLPPGLGFNTTNGLISGVPTLAGVFQTMLTTSNAVGSGASVLNITIFNTGNSIVQEIWTNVPGINVADIPIGNPANITNTLGSLGGVTNYAKNYGERVRGYFTAPATGNYYFWIAGSDSAQLWISDDSEPVNAVLRAYVTPTNSPTAPGENGTAPQQWNVQASQQSAWLSLVAGQQYFIQILHKAGAGTNDNWSVGWLLDPTGTNTSPSGIVPGYVLARYYPPLPSAIPGTLYTANMLALPGVNSTGVGIATLRVSADGTQATLNFQLNNLAGSPTAESIDSDPYLNKAGELVFDISAAKIQPNGSYLWNIANIKPSNPLTLADIDEIIQEGKASINIESTVFPNGEISGHFTAADGTQNFTPPPPPQVWTDDHTDPNAAARFLTQATFGASPNDIAAVQALGYAGWLNQQFSLPASHSLPIVLANPYSDPTDLYQSPLWFNAWWRQSCTAPDQLRQRVAFALSEIMVVSENGVLQNQATALASYYDTLLDNAFGNYRSLLQAVTLTPAMGEYLNMQGNNAGSIITGLHANENYAREIQQLFSIGLNRVWPDGTLILNSQGNLVPTYNQNVVMGFAATFTGWNYYQANQINGRAPSNWFPPANYTNAMVLVPAHHDLGAKLLLDNVVLPPAQGLQAVATNAVFDTYGQQNLQAAMDSIYNNQNVGPFICRQLIQRLVTSNPSRDYLYRVTQVFNNDGTGVRGNLQAVVEAILLDYEARSTNLISQPTYGKQREPLLRATAIARAFPSPPSVSGTYSESGTQAISITTAAPHRLSTGDTVFLAFTDTSSNAAPISQGYSVTNTGATTFTVNAVDLFSTGSYGQTNQVITVNISNHGLAVGNPVYLFFTTGGASNGVYQVASVADSSHFTVATTDPSTLSGFCLIPKLAVGGYTQIGVFIVVSTTGPHGLLPGDNVFINFTSGSAVDGQYQVATVSDPSHFVVVATNSANQNQNSLSVYPLVAPRITRNGTVTVQQSTWNMSYTDLSSTASLSQSPLRSPTVFNYYFPGYEFPGALASAGLTTPEFQLTSDTGVALQMNFLGGAITNGGNTSGLNSFIGGNGAIVLDIGPWMTTNYTSATGAATLVQSLNSLLAAGQLSAAAQSNIVKEVTNITNYPYGGVPSATQMRNRVREAIFQTIASPSFTIQK
jgi:hypothetical protein